MKKIEYIFQSENIVTVLVAKYSNNSKLGIGTLISTYHFSIDQIRKNDIKIDSVNCLDCPLSFTNSIDGKSKCYTHKGMQGLGLRSMIKRLNKLKKIDAFDQIKFNAFVNYIDAMIGKVDLVRFGAYGEPTFLKVDQVATLSKLGRNHTGYTHQWHKIDPAYGEFFRASTHNVFERQIANDKGFKVYEATTEDTDGVICPASKESGRKSSCIKCGLCNGTKTEKNIFISMH